MPDARSLADSVKLKTLWMELTAPGILAVTGPPLAEFELLGPVVTPGMRDVNTLAPLYSALKAFRASIVSGHGCYCHQNW